MQKEAEEYIGKPMTIWLISGIKLSGTVTSVNERAIKLTRDGSTMSVFLHAIATMAPDGLPRD